MSEAIIRRATHADQKPLSQLVEIFATSFTPSEDDFRKSFARLVVNHSTCLLVAEADTLVGYLLGFAHDTFYANGPVAWVEEVIVDESRRRQHVGLSLMRTFELWAANRGCRLVALATRRAEPFYRSLGYEDSATYFRLLFPMT
jgi:GNAT superfamily N-acetyltransferase